MAYSNYFYRIIRLTHTAVVICIIGAALCFVFPGNRMSVYLFSAIGIVSCCLIAEKLFPGYSRLCWLLLCRLPGVSRFLAHEHWNEVKDNDYKTQNPDRYRDCLNFLTEELLPRLSLDSSLVADIGCGDGWFVRFIAPHCRRVCGFDFSSSLLEVARLRSKEFKNVVFEQSDIISAPLTGQYDCLSLQGVFMYIIEPSMLQAAAANVLHSLNDKGILVLRDAFCVNGPEVIVPEIGSVYRHLEIYLEFWQKQKLRLLASRNIGDAYEIQHRRIQNVIFLFVKEDEND